METTTELLTARLHSLECELTDFIAKYFQVTPADGPGSSIVVISASGNQFYGALPDEAKPIQNGLVQRFRRLRQLVAAIFAYSTEANKETLDEAFERIEALIACDGLTWHKTAAEAASDLKERVLAVGKLISAVFPPDRGKVLLVVDTNGLYSSPDLQEWTLAGTDSIVVCLTPAVLGELDEHKVHHRNAAIPEKARTWINRLKEYRRRGSLTDGVDVVKGKIRVLAIATEPDFSSTLPWLNPDNHDDRLIASTIELLRSRAGCPVAIMTGDINLQNKCEFAAIPFIEPMQGTDGRAG